MPKPYHTPKSERDEILGTLILDEELAEIALENTPDGPAFDEIREFNRAALALAKEEGR